MLLRCIEKDYKQIKLLALRPYRGHVFQGVESCMLRCVQSLNVNSIASSFDEFDMYTVRRQ
jgi:hypothetical protein